MCFKCPNSKTIISDIQKGGLNLDTTIRKPNQVYIEVYQSADKKQNSDSPTGIMIPNSSSPDFRRSTEIVPREKELLSKIEDYKQTINKYKKTMQTMDKKNEENEAELKKQLEQIVNHNMEVEKYKTKAKEAHDKVKEYEKEHIAMCKQVELMKISLEKKDERIIELHVLTSKGDDASAEKTAHITALQEQLSVANETFKKLESSMSDITRMYQQKCQECNELLATVNQLRFSNEELKSSANVYQGKYESMRDQLNDYNSKIADLNSVIKESNKTIEDLKKMFPE
jgi:chromosome segregation ATPase